MSTSAADISIDELEADPYPIYARLRREAPVVEVPAANCWFATRWDDILTISRSDDFTAESPEAPVNAAFGTPNILTSDGPIHKGLCEALEPHYTHAAVAGYIDDLVRPLAEAQLDLFVNSGDNDLVGGYFEPLSSLALARSLGLDDVDGPTLQRWFHGMSLGAINFERDPEKQAACDAVCAEVEAVVLPILDELAASPTERPLAQLLYGGMVDGRMRGYDEIMPTLKVTLLGGMQEPGHGAATVLTGLLADRPQYEAVNADRSLMKAAVDEGLRWVSPIGTSMRTAIRDTEVGGVEVPAGTPVSCILASANRDESRFPDADRFDISRAKKATIVFGTGAHLCTGKWFARSLIDISLNLLLDHFDEIVLAEHPDFIGWEFRGPREMRIELP